MEQQRDYTKRTPREKAFFAIDTERAYQDTKYGAIGDGPLDRGHMPVLVWELLLARYLEKLKHETDAVEATKIIRKIAALCVACMEQHGAPPREVPTLTGG